jgi:hypothetical protein
MLEGMAHTQTTGQEKVIDLTGLPDEAVRAVESLVSLLRGQVAPQGGRAFLSSREEWAKAVREWAASHEPQSTSADWGRESIYAGP